MDSSANKILEKVLHFTSKAYLLQDGAEKKTDSSMESICFVLGFKKKEKKILEAPLVKKYKGKRKVSEM